MEHIWTVICKNSTIDRNTNNVSLFELLEEVNINIDIKGKKPEGVKFALPMEFQVVTLWGRSERNTPEKGVGRLTTLDPSGNKISENVYDVDLSTHTRNRTITKYLGLPVPMSGIYTFFVEHKRENETEWKKASIVPLEISLKVSEQSAH